MVLPSAPPAPSASWNARAARAFPVTSNGEYGIPTAKVPVLSRGAGARVWDTEGREYLDLTLRHHR